MRGLCDEFHSIQTHVHRLFFKWLVKDLYSSYEVPFHVKMAVLDWFSGRIKLVLVHVY